MHSGREDQAPSVFLNVDLDIRSSSNLEPLLVALCRQKKAFVLNSGLHKRTYFASLELDGRGGLTANQTLRRLCALIQALPKTERELWDKAKVRDFSLGVEPRLDLYCDELPIAADTLETVAELNARIVFCVYAPDQS